MSVTCLAVAAMSLEKFSTKRRKSVSTASPVTTWTVLGRRTRPTSTDASRVSLNEPQKYESSGNFRQFQAAERDAAAHHAHLWTVAAVVCAKTVFAERARRVSREIAIILTTKLNKILFLSLSHNRTVRIA
jgi:hypothetical protein